MYRVKSLILVSMVIILITETRSEGIKCYFCTGNETTCGLEALKTKANSTCPSNYGCFLQLTYKNDGITVEHIVRNCAYVKYSTNCNTNHVAGFNKYETCHCNTDLCNSNPKSIVEPTPIYKCHACSNMNANCTSGNDFDKNNTCSGGSCIHSTTYYQNSTDVIHFYRGCVTTRENKGCVSYYTPTSKTVNCHCDGELCNKDPSNIKNSNNPPAPRNNGISIELNNIIFTLIVLISNFAIKF